MEAQRKELILKLLAVRVIASVVGFERGKSVENFRKARGRSFGPRQAKRYGVRIAADGAPAIQKTLKDRRASAAKRIEDEIIAFRPSQ